MKGFSCTFSLLDLKKKKEKLNIEMSDHYLEMQSVYIHKIKKEQEPEPAQKALQIIKFILLHLVHFRIQEL